MISRNNRCNDTKNITIETAGKTKIISDYPPRPKPTTNIIDDTILNSKFHDGIKSFISEFTMFTALKNC